MTHISPDYCQAIGIPIHPINQLVKIEGTGGCYTICGLHRGTLWKTVWCATQSSRKVQAQQSHKHMVKITKHITLPPYPTTIVQGHTKLKGHGLKLNLIAEPSENNQLPSSVQCTPTYCNLEPGSNRVTVGLGNVSAKQITVPSRTVVCQIQLANMVPKLQTPTGQDPSDIKEDNSWIQDQLDLGEISTWSVE